MTTLTNQYNLAICIRSGQVSAQQVQEHLKDKDFHDYYMNNFYQNLVFDQMTNEVVMLP